MQLRDHPLMTYRGVANWPPVWVTNTDPPKKLLGEVGVLTGITADPSTRKCFLHIEYENEGYVGALLFEDAMFCWLLCRIISNQIGRGIKEIGDFDLSFAL